MGMVFIETFTAGSGGASFLQIQNIPQDGLDLLLKISARKSTTNYQGNITINGPQASNTFAAAGLYGNGSSTTVYDNPNSGSGGYIYQGASNYTANTFNNTEIYISNYTTSEYKPISIDTVNENNAQTAFAGIFSNTWKSAAAVTEIRIYDSLVAGSTISLYKITAD
jgi:hypothetical protein